MRPPNPASRMEIVRPARYLFISGLSDASSAAETARRYSGSPGFSSWGRVFETPGKGRARVFVQRRADFAGCQYALRHLESERAGNVRIGVGDRVIERLASPAL